MRWSWSSNSLLGWRRWREEEILGNCRGSCDVVGRGNRFSVFCGGTGRRTVFLCTAGGQSFGAPQRIREKGLFIAFFPVLVLQTDWADQTAGRCKLTHKSSIMVVPVVAKLPSTCFRSRIVPSRTQTHTSAFVAATERNVVACSSTCSCSSWSSVPPFFKPAPSLLSRGTGLGAAPRSSGKKVLLRAFSSTSSTSGSPRPPTTGKNTSSLPPKLGQGISLYEQASEVNDATSRATFQKPVFGAAKRPYCLVLSPKWPNRTVAEALWDQDEAHKIAEAAGYAPLPHPLCRMLHPRRSNPKYFVSRSDVERMVKRLADLYEGVDDLEHLTMMAIDRERAFDSSEDVLEGEEEMGRWGGGSTGETTKWEEEAEEDDPDGDFGPRTAAGAGHTSKHAMSKPTGNKASKKHAPNKPSKRNRDHSGSASPGAQETTSSPDQQEQQDLKFFVEATLKNSQYMRRKALVPSKYDPPECVFVNGHISPRQQYHIEVICSVIDGATSGRNKNMW